MNELLQRTKSLSDLIEETKMTYGSTEISWELTLGTVLHWLEVNKAKKRKVFVIGNGGSSGIASHHVTDLINVLGVAAFPRWYSNILTCIGNDYGYPYVFSNPLEKMACSGDLLIAVSSSGKSENILNACRMMHQKGGNVITLSGFLPDNPLRSLGDLNIWTPAEDYGLVETAHFFILHTFVDTWARKKQTLTDFLKGKVLHESYGENS